MKNRRLLSGFLGLLSFLLLTILLSPEVFPRAGAGQKYTPLPTRPTYTSRPTATRPTYTSRPTATRPTYTSRPTATRPTYTSTGTPTGHITSSPTPRAHDTVSGSESGSGGSSSGGGCSSGCMFIVIGVIILIVIIFGKKKGGQSRGGGSYIPGGGSPPQSGGYIPAGQSQTLTVDDLPKIDRQKVEAQLETLKERDPNFSEKVFIDKAQTSFYEIQRAWSRNDLEPVRKNMSESQYKRMNMQLDEYRDKGWTNKVEDLVIGGVKVCEAGVESEYDYIEVQIAASMSDKTFDKDGKMVEGSNQILPVVEYWRFHRKQGAKTNADGGRTVSHNCPNCGAPIDEGESSKCPYCETTITNASFDWVLNTITQAAEKIR